MVEHEICLLIWALSHNLWHVNTKQHWRMNLYRAGASRQRACSR